MDEPRDEKQKPKALLTILLCALMVAMEWDTFSILFKSSDSSRPPGLGSGIDQPGFPLPGDDVEPRPSSTVTETHVELPSDVTSQKESARVDTVPIRHLTWKHCSPGVDGFLSKAALIQLQQQKPSEYSRLQCANRHVPLDYDDPQGPKITLNIIRRVADKPQKRIGSLFVHPGGPGYSGAPMLYMASKYFSQDVLESFDLITIESRGVEGSEKEHCFTIKKDPNDATLFGPLRTKAEHSMFESRASRIAWKCSALLNEITGHSSTANTVRDIEVVRQSVGDEKLSFYGFSYGTVVGQTYADMFPDRVRVMALDGTVNSPDWYGTDGNSNENLMLRTQSAQAVDETLTELLARCDAVSEKDCALSARPGSSLEAYLQVKEKLKQDPIKMGKPYTKNTQTIDDRAFAILISTLLGDSKTVAYVPVFIDGFLHAFDASQYERSQKVGKLFEKLPEGTQMSQPWAGGVTATSSGLGLNPKPPYMNVSPLVVACSEIARPDLDTALARANTHPWMLAGGAKGLFYTECSHPGWTAFDDGRFTGPMGARTSAPLLIVGNYADPVTSYRQAEKAAARIPHNYLVLSDNWGHGAAPNSPCMRRLIGDYLLNGEKPGHGRCFAPQPFA